MLIRILKYKEEKSCRRENARIGVIESICIFLKYFDDVKCIKLTHEIINLIEKQLERMKPDYLVGDLRKVPEIVNRISD